MSTANSRMDGSAAAEPSLLLVVVTWPKVRKGLGFPARAFAILL